MDYSSFSSSQQTPQLRQTSPTADIDHPSTPVLIPWPAHVPQMPSQQWGHSRPPLKYGVCVTEEPAGHPTWENLEFMDKSELETHVRVPLPALWGCSTISRTGEVLNHVPKNRAPVPINSHPFINNNNNKKKRLTKQNLKRIHRLIIPQTPRTQ